MSTLTGGIQPTSNHLRSALEYKIYNTQKEERFWLWLAELYDREKRFDKDHPRTAMPAPIVTPDTSETWECCSCQVVIVRENARKLDYAIYSHVQLFHDPSGINTAKTKARNIRVSITESTHIPGAWVLKLDEIVIHFLFLGADGHSRAQRRMKDFL